MLSPGNLLSDVGLVRLCETLLSTQHGLVQRVLLFSLLSHFQRQGLLVICIWLDEGNSYGDSNDAVAVGVVIDITDLGWDRYVTTELNPAR